MSLSHLHEDDVFALREFPLGEELSSYITALTQNAPEIFVFRTGAGRILRDLLLHWPTLNNRESQAQELCERVVDAVYPLVSATFARGVEITVVISTTPIAPPDRVDAMSTYVLFDPENDIERHCFLSPHHALPPAHVLSLSCGIVILCRPLFYRYHTIKDDRKRGGHPGAGIFELSERMIKELLSRPNFVPHEKIALAKIVTKIHDLAKASEQIDPPAKTEVVRVAAPPRPEPIAPSQIVGVAAGLSRSPAMAAVLIRLLMLYVMNKGFSSDLRLELRKIAQSLRALYPLAFIENAARSETISPHINPSTHTVHSFRRSDLKNAEQAIYNRLKPQPALGFPKSTPETRTGVFHKATLSAPAPFPLRPTFRSRE